MTNKEAIEILKSFQPVDALGEAMDMAIKALEEQQWIPIESIDDVPDHEVMCCDKNGEEMFGYLCYNEQWLCESDSTIMYNPIAYREKPEPYKEGE